MQVVIIGSGNLAWVLSKSLVKIGHSMLQVYSRNILHAEQLATAVGASATNDLQTIRKDADIYFIAVSDEAISIVVQQLQLGDKPVFHTAGTVNKNVLANTTTNYGVFWPMKMLNKSMHDFGAIQLVVDAVNDESLRIIQLMSAQLSNGAVVANDSTRMKMHLMAAFASNFTNHIYHLCANYCQEEAIDFSIFYTLIEDAAKAIQQHPPAQLQAGPAFRNNVATLNKHRKLLESKPALLEVYNCLTDSIQEKFIKKAHSNE